MDLKKTKNKKSVLWLVCILALLSVSLGAILVASADDIPAWTGNDLQPRYVSNRMLTVPVKTVTAAGQSAQASAVVHLPDGSAQKVDSLFLEQTGKYTVSYTADLDGKLYSQQYAFDVVSANVLTGEKSTAVWGESEQYSDTGLMIGLARGETLTFANTVDVASLTSATAGETPLLELYVTPERIGSTDFRRLYITFTDSVDPTQTVTVLLGEFADGRPETMVSASPKGQQYTSWEWYSDSIFRGEDSWHAHANTSFNATYGANNHAQKDRPIMLWYESDTRQIFYHTLDSANVSSNKKMLIDLDDTKFYNTLFEGFSSGRVRVSMRADKYNRDTLARFTVKRLGDIDLSKEVADFGTPSITVDSPFALDDVPNAAVGGAYLVPAATAVDGEGTPIPVRTAVYRTNNGISGRIDVPVANGRFVTDKSGEYHIVYTATDRGGKTATQTVKVHTRDGIEKPTVSASVANTATAGEPTDLSQISLTGSCATVSVAVDGVSVETVSDYVFERTGEHTVTYTVTDVCGQTAEKTYTVTVTSPSAPKCLTAPQLPDVLIAGCRYYMPELSAYTFDENGKTAVTTECYITDNRGTRKVARGEVCVPAVAKNGDEVTVTYKAGEDTVYQTEIGCVQAYTVQNGRNRIQIENYFVGDLEYAKNTDSMTCTATKDGNDNAFVFARKLPAEEFGVMLGTIPELSSFDAVRVTLFEPETGVSISFTVDCDLDVSPDGYRRKAGYVSTGTGVNRTRISMPALYIRDGGTVTGMYKNGNWVFNGDYSVRIALDDNGNPFNGFGDAEVYCRVSMEGAKAGAAFNVYDICGQTISSNPLDGIAPTIRVEGDYGGDKTLGSSIVVGKATAFDVLDAMTTLGVSVTAPDGSFVTSDDGVLLENVSCEREYTFTVSQYGTYAVYYRAFDSLGGNTRQFSYSYTVSDNTAPVIEFKSDVPTTGKVGTAFVIPDFTVTDDMTASENTIVYKSVIAPNLDSSYLKSNANSYVPKYAGEYTVVITAIDEHGNTCVQSFTVEVSA